MLRHEPRMHVAKAGRLMLSLIHLWRQRNIPRRQEVREALFHSNGVELLIVRRKSHLKGGNAGQHAAAHGNGVGWAGEEG